LLLYIHGFRTTKISQNASLIKKYYKDRVIVSNHSTVPTQAIKDLEEIIESQNITGIIASSLGGFYATYLSQKHNLKSVLINPSVIPYETTTKYLGENIKDNGEKFIWKDEHLSMLETLKIDKVDLKLDNFFLFLQRGDKVLDYRYADDFYLGAKLIIEDEGDHKFEGLDRYLEEISDFLDLLQIAPL